MNVTLQQQETMVTQLQADQPLLLRQQNLNQHQSVDTRIIGSKRCRHASDRQARAALQRANEIRRLELQYARVPLCRGSEVP